MDKIRFEVFLDGPYESVLSIEARFVRTIINERSILDIAEEYERDSLKLKRAGGYEYQFADVLYRYLTDENERKGGRIGLLICGCFCEGCYPLYTIMEEAEHVVTWRNFFNPHVCFGNRGNNKCYDIGPFCFDKAEFYREAEKLKSHIS